jgi:hypothetical protein
MTFITGRIAAAPHIIGNCTDAAWDEQSPLFQVASELTQLVSGTPVTALLLMNDAKDSRK